AGSFKTRDVSTLHRSGSLSTHVLDAIDVVIAKQRPGRIPRWPWRQFGNTLNQNLECSTWPKKQQSHFPPDLLYQLVPSRTREIASHKSPSYSGDIRYCDLTW